MKWLLLTIFVWLTAGAWCTQQPCIRLHEQSIVKNAQFTLGDVADFVGIDTQTETRLKAVVLGASPLPGLERVITREQVLIRLRQHGFQPEAFEIVVPARAVVRREVHSLQPPQIAAVAIEKLHQSACLPEDAQVECDPAPRALSLPHDRVQITAGEPRALGAGLYTVPVQVVGEGIAPITVNVRLRTTFWREAVVATRAIHTGEAIGADAVALRTVAVLEDNDDLITDPSEVAGKIAKRPIAAGQPVRRTSIDEPAVVRRGQTVKLLVKLDGAVIETGAVAQQDGKVGARVRVLVTDTRKTLLATVVDAQTVMLDVQ